MAGRGHASKAFWEKIWSMGVRPAVPVKRREIPVVCHQWVYRCRHLVGNMWARLKEWRTVATRYEKTTNSFRVVIRIAASCDWLKL